MANDSWCHDCNQPESRCECPTLSQEARIFIWRWLDDCRQIDRNACMKDILLLGRMLDTRLGVRADYVDRQPQAVSEVRRLDHLVHQICLLAEHAFGKKPNTAPEWLAEKVQNELKEIRDEITKLSHRANTIDLLERELAQFKDGR